MDLDDIKGNEINDDESPRVNNLHRVMDGGAMERNEKNRKRLSQAVNAFSWRQTVRRSKNKRRGESRNDRETKREETMSFDDWYKKEKEMLAKEKQEINALKPKLWTKAFFLCVTIAAGPVTTIGVLFELEWYWIVALAIPFGIAAGLISLMIDYPERFK